MIKVQVSGDGVVYLTDRINRLRNIDFLPFMQQEAEPAIRDGNRKGLMEGRNKMGAKMPPTQRQKGQGSARRLGSGPPLVPRGSASRAIALARTDSGKKGQYTYYAMIYWDGFTSKGGREILPMHARGWTYPVRDVIGIRPETRRLLNRMARAYAYRWVSSETRRK